MKTIHVRLDEDLLREVDRIARGLGTTRSGFAQNALREAVGRIRVAQLERQHREGYAKHPVQPGQFDGWEDEQAWGEE